MNKRVKISTSFRVTTFIFDVFVIAYGEWFASSLKGHIP